jgi:hypothetical protein|tara:strand:+ start:333 stop:482 length:150 start_codon:yes stop_codon:yes gene_type:complete
MATAGDKIASANNAYVEHAMAVSLAMLIASLAALLESKFLFLRANIDVP